MDLNEFDELMGLNALRSEAGKANYGLINEIDMIPYRAMFANEEAYEIPDLEPDDDNPAADAGRDCSPSSRITPLREETRDDRDQQ